MIMATVWFSFPLAMLLPASTAATTDQRTAQLAATGRSGFQLMSVGS